MSSCDAREALTDLRAVWVALSSNQAGERANAVRAAERIILERRVTWEELRQAARPASGAQVLNFWAKLHAGRLGTAQDLRIVRALLLQQAGATVP